VADPELDGSEAGMGPKIPPDVRVVLEGVGLDPAVDEQLELLVGSKGRRQAGAGERLEDLHPRRGEPGRPRLPERRVDREGKELREIRAHAVRACDRLLRRVEADVHVQPEDELALGDPAHRLDEVDVALLESHLLVLVTREGMRARRGDDRVALGRHVAQTPAEALQLLHGLAHGRRDVGRHLDHGLEELRLDALLLPVALEGRKDLVDPGDELVALGVEDLELLLDTETERRALAEVLLHGSGDTNGDGGRRRAGTSDEGPDPARGREGGEAALLLAWGRGWERRDAGARAAPSRGRIHALRPRCARVRRLAAARLG